VGKLEGESNTLMIEMDTGVGVCVEVGGVVVGSVVDGEVVVGSVDDEAVVGLDVVAAVVGEVVVVADVPVHPPRTREIITSKITRIGIVSLFIMRPPLLIYSHSIVEGGLDVIS
jgi:hypothetical protein